MAIEVTAPAKVNLALHVTGRRADGYHLLDSVVGFADLGDRLRFDVAEDLSLSVIGPFAAGVPTDGANLILKAAALMKGEGQGARIALEKHLPHGGGIGGGSSDAAATLRALSRLWQVPLPDPSQVLALGADVPVCLAAFVTGYGDCYPSSVLSASPDRLLDALEETEQSFVEERAAALERVRLSNLPPEPVAGTVAFEDVVMAEPADDFEKPIAEEVI